MRTEVRPREACMSLKAQASRNLRNRVQDLEPSQALTDVEERTSEEGVILPRRKRQLRPPMAES